MNSYNNIACFVLDFGGVLYNISHQSTYKAFFSLSKDKEKFNSYKMKEYLNDEFIFRFEKGLISPEEFRYLVKKKFTIDADDTKFDDAFNTTLLGIKSDAIRNVSYLKNKGKVYLLSNTNKIHFNHFKNECKELFDLFDGLFFSHLIGARKPEPEIFNYLSKNTGILPQVSLFIDDSAENVDAALNFGFQTYLVDNTNFLSDLIHNV
ncbi:MAG: HAD family phosphatase [Bacteroidetes bacterium]|nr:MAG: HAD family phosphatase [Bacteroidota bacterium]